MTQRSEPPASVPQVPPGCSNFEDEGKDGCWFGYPAPGAHEIVWLRPPDNAGHIIRTDFERRTPKWRPIIAAVAEVAWLKEAERLRKTGCTDAKCICQDASLAQNNARAWRKWGAE